MSLTTRDSSSDELEADGKNIPAAITDTGCERELNEDRYAVIECAVGTLWIVCDGMGGEEGGELAAQLVIDGIQRDLDSAPPRSPVSTLKRAVLEGNRIIVLRRQNPIFASMGTTIVAVVLAGQEVVLGHVGDSRAYLLQGGEFKTLTVDHTYVQELVDQGKITHEEALTHPQAHILTKAIGASPALEFETRQFWLWPAEEENSSGVIVLCSDGLYTHVREEEMRGIVAGETPRQACSKLVELAKLRGGYDNITVAVIPLEGELRDRPPPGYEDKRARRARVAAASKAERKAMWWSTIATVSALSILSVLVVILVMLFKLSE